jgi:hypothetical protein
MVVSSAAAVRLLVLTAAVAAVACTQSPTAPPAPVRGTKASRDTVPLEGDSTLCRSGYITINNRIVCKDPE